MSVPRSSLRYSGLMSSLAHLYVTIAYQMPQAKEQTTTRRIKVIESASSIPFSLNLCCWKKPAPAVRCINMKPAIVLPRDHS